MTERPALHPKTPPSQMLVVLPASEEKIDEKLVAAAVVWIRAKVEATVHKGAVEIGEYVLDKFFEGDAGNVSSRSPYKSASFRKLAETCETSELPISRTALQNAVGLAVMRRLIPGKTAAFAHLAPTHQTVLLPLRDPAKVEWFANRATSKHMSVRVLKELVAAEVAKGALDKSSPGRRRRPAILKVLDGSSKLFELAGPKKTFSAAQVEELSAEQTRRALATAHDLMARINGLVGKLEKKKKQ